MYCCYIKDVQNVLSKLHLSGKSTIKKTLFNAVTLRFTQVKGNFINDNDQFKSERSILSRQLLHKPTNLNT